tara:strand:+ start:2022 stop:2828 length:807 start_codon:yes stop_codon:yes gene_type:complete
MLSLFTPDDIIQYNKIAHLHDGKKVFFCKTDYLNNLFDTLKNYDTPCILITGNSDIGITDEMVDLAPACIKKWFAQGVVTNNPLVVGMPYGVDNHEDCIVEGHGKGWSNLAMKPVLLSNPPARIFDPQKELYANFSISTHPIRKKVHDICKNLDYVTTTVSLSHKESVERSYIKYINDILNHKMVVCPRGNAPAETHRFWETLYLGRVPIIKKNRGNSFFTELPVVVLESWDDLTNLDFINSQYEKVKNNSKDMLYIEYWKSRILNEC